MPRVRSDHLPNQCTLMFQSISRLARLLARCGSTGAASLVVAIVCCGTRHLHATQGNASDELHFQDTTALGAATCALALMTGTALADEFNTDTLQPRAARVSGRHDPQMPAGLLRNLCLLPPPRRGLAMLPEIGGAKRYAVPPLRSIAAAILISPDSLLLDGARLQPYPDAMKLSRFSIISLKNAMTRLVRSFESR